VLAGLQGRQSTERAWLVRAAASRAASKWVVVLGERTRGQRFAGSMPCRGTRSEPAACCRRHLRSREDSL